MAIMNALLQQRMDLYTQLLECTELQKNIYLNGEQEEMLSSFLPISYRWDSIRRELDDVQQQLQALGDAETQRSDDVIQIMKRTLENIHYIQNGIDQTTQDTSENLQSVKQQRKVMNAYYNLKQQDQISLYFDEKK
ncbi:hypothetical protein [Paenibacillus sp. ACRRY]|uniref:hypothetical protein n=1 Tax=Paenibacillus sp. ACRRY TaxID=2918208 RepID=UPI001EF6B9F7|nr:hypothetical protein [Paenibacillus sp. ACRRY]